MEKVPAKKHECQLQLHLFTVSKERVTGTGRSKECSPGP